MIDVKVDTAGLDAALDKFATKLRTDVVTVGAAAAAKEFYIEAKLRCPVLENPDKQGGHWFYGTNARYHFPAGNLRDAIYRVLSEDNTGNGKTTYHVAWNHQKAPYGFMVEFGTSRAAAHPFMRPAYEAAKSSAIVAAQEAMRIELEKSS